MFSRRSILSDTLASETSQGNSFANTFTGASERWKQNEKWRSYRSLKHIQDTLLGYIPITVPAGRNKQLSPQWNVLQRMFITRWLPSETTGRICLAVSCWMAACVCFWKTSLASHLQGSSTTSTFTSLLGESKFHISVTESEKAHRIPPTLLFSN